MPSEERDEVLEYLVFEQLLKDYDLTREELETGWDGANDGGVDGFFTIVNGHLLRAPSSFAWPKNRSTRGRDSHSETSRNISTPLNNLLATLPELFDFLAATRLILSQSIRIGLLDARALFHSAYRRLAWVTPTLSFKFVYASRGDTAEVAQNVSARGDKIVQLAESLFRSSSASFEFVGASKLVRPLT